MSEQTEQIDNADISRRLTEIVEARHRQGITDEQMIARARLRPDEPMDPERFAELVEKGLDASGPPLTSELLALCEGLFIDFDWLMTGTAGVLYSPCSLQRLFDAHYGRS